jgi:hypothetical protein
MTTDDPEPVDTTDAEDAQILLADPDDYHQTQRLREIHKARRKVNDILTEIDGYTDEGTHKSQKSRLAHAVSAYIAELEPVLAATDVDTDLSEKMPWDSLHEFADYMGTMPESGKRKRSAGYQLTLLVYRQANSAFAEVKPLVEKEESDEWEV